MRGKVQLLPVHHDKVGITPACAGKRLRCTSVQTFRWDHPRMCGEKLIPCGQCIGCRGSPPHMRGKATSGLGLRRPLRITPAYAGKSRCCSRRAACGSDHPRTCGEKCQTIGQACDLGGSPPHVRGKGLLQIFIPEPFRITPACAGKSFCWCISNHRNWDHPRVCGEKYTRNIEAIRTLGSPPHVRGKAEKNGDSRPGVGITPAHAGKRKSCAAQKTSAWDHPRTCGEKSTLASCIRC